MKSILIYANPAEFATASEYVDNALQNRYISDEIIRDTDLCFEELFLLISDLYPGVPLEISLAEHPISFPLF